MKCKPSNLMMCGKFRQAFGGLIAACSKAFVPHRLSSVSHSDKLQEQRWPSRTFSPNMLCADNTLPNLDILLLQALCRLPG